MRNWSKMLATLALGTAAAGCMMPYGGGPTNPAQLGARFRDTRPAETRLAWSGEKPAEEMMAQWRNPDGRSGMPRFDEAVATSEAIGDSAPDIEFQLLGAPVWAWTNDAGDMVIMEQIGDAEWRYFFGAEDNTPYFVMNSAIGGFAFDENGRALARFGTDGSVAAVEPFNTERERAEAMAVRGQSLRLMALSDDPQPSDYAQNVEPYRQPSLLSGGSWLGLYLASGNDWYPDYGRYRRHPDSRDRHRRWRNERERRRGRHGQPPHGEETGQPHPGGEHPDRPRRPGGPGRRGDGFGPPGMTVPPMGRQPEPPTNDRPTRLPRPEPEGTIGTPPPDGPGARRVEQRRPRPQRTVPEALEGDDGVHSNDGNGPGMSAPRPRPVIRQQPVPMTRHVPPAPNAAPPAAAPRYTPPPAPQAAPQAAPSPSYSPPAPRVSAPPPPAPAPRPAPPPQRHEGGQVRDD